MRNTYVANKSRICVNLLPPLGIVYRVVVVRGIVESSGEALVHTGNLESVFGA